MKVNSILIFFSKRMFQIHLPTHCCGQWSQKKLNTISAESLLLTSRSSPGKVWESALGVQRGPRSPGRDTRTALCPYAQAFNNQLKASVFVNGSLFSGRRAWYPHSKSAKLLSPSLAREPQSLPALQEPTRSNYLFTSEHVMGLPISWRVSFQRIMPAMPFIWKSPVYPRGGRASVVCFLSASDKGEEH